MPPKRKSDAMESAVLDALDTNAPTAVASGSSEPAAKKARASADASGSKEKDKASQKPKTWKDVELEGEDDGGVPVYDDCAEVRRKIRLLQKTPGWKVTHWLREIGDINTNSYKRFMEAKGRNDGAANGTYYAAYVYFEKVRILEGKKKTTTRKNNEATHFNGFPLQNPPRYVWGPSGR